MNFQILNAVSARSILKTCNHLLWCTDPLAQEARMKAFGITDALWPYISQIILDPNFQENCLRFLQILTPILLF